MIPNDFVGAWQRVSIALGDAEPTETMSVVWLQTRSAYADLRIPFDPAGQAVCFAGRTSWVPPKLHWSHEIDLEGGPEASTDEGEISWRDGDMVERGVFVIDGVDTPYVEVWRRAEGSDGPLLEVVQDGFTRIVVGDHELTIDDGRADGGAFTATYSVSGVIVHDLEVAGALA